MKHGYTYYIDQPLRRIWFTCGMLPAMDHWGAVIQSPQTLPNELYRLVAGECKHVPLVVVGTEFNLVDGDHEAAENWMTEAVIAEIKNLQQGGYGVDVIRETVINVDEAVRMIRCLRSALTVNAGLYYDHDTTAVTDEEWDAMAYKLVELHERYAYALPYVNFFDQEFQDFDGSTGYHLPYRLEPFTHHIQRALEYLAVNLTPTLLQCNLNSTRKD